MAIYVGGKGRVWASRFQKRGDFTLLTGEHRQTSRVMRARGAPRFEFKSSKKKNLRGVGGRLPASCSARGHPVRLSTVIADSATEEVSVKTSYLLGGSEGAGL